MPKTFVKKCDVCRENMISGFVYEYHKSKKIYCSMNCVKQDIKKQKKINRAERHKRFYYKCWKDIVFVVFDNQYESLEDAQFIVENFGQPKTKIKERAYDPFQPLFKINNGVQIMI